VYVPAEIDVRKIRRRLKLSQDEFAAKFGIPAATLRDWSKTDASRKVPPACS
jgi:putative transcriptional regulator